MCTVSFIPVRDTYFITSNRDEKNTRQKALNPAVHTYSNCRLIFPTDQAAGGSWIALKENGDAGVLLNGAFLPHKPKPGYRRSRGLLFLDMLSQKSPSRYFDSIDLENIEPFTLLVFESGSLYEFRWDGNEKYCRQLPVTRPQIWSSATLYDGLIIKKREQWFASFLNQRPAPTQLDILNFHRFGGDGSTINDLLMERDNTYSTVSITSIFLTPDRGGMKYIDTKDNSFTEIKIELLESHQAI